MLKSLSINNYILIEELEVSLSDAMNVITGETGAGKSILLGAMGLLSGNRADSKVLLNKNEKCVVEGAFDLTNYKLKKVFKQQELNYQKECIIRRQIAPNGRSRAFINDEPVTLDVLKEIGKHLIDIHSQHDTLQLGSNEFQLNILDDYAQNIEDRKAYKQVYKTYKNAEKIYTNLLLEAKNLQKEYDYNNFLLEELNKLPLETLNQEELESELEKLENVEHIKSQLAATFNGLSHPEHSVEMMLSDCLAELSKTVAYGAVYENLYERLNSTFIEIKDLAQEIESESENLVVNEEQVEVLRERLSTLFNLQQKHQVDTVEALVEIRDELAKKVSAVDNFDEETQLAKKQLSEAQEKLYQVANVLSQTRKSVIAEIENSINKSLQSLGMPNARLLIELQTVEVSSSGIDQAEFLFTANKGIAAQALREVASGGEFSRLMLGVKFLMASKIKLPTMVFDEIDTGISGEIAIKVGNMLKHISQNHQIIVISHLPQVACKGNVHYFVYKDTGKSSRTTSKIRRLTEDERILEIAQMIGGANPSPNTFQSARELLYD